jgi:cytochrome c oxidase cbb3-type subunit 4
MDQNDARAVVTLLGFVAFLGVVLWAYSRKSKPGFDEAAQLPFADETEEPKSGTDRGLR